MAATQSVQYLFCTLAWYTKAPKRQSPDEPRVGTYVCLHIVRHVSVSVDATVARYALDHVWYQTDKSAFFFQPVIKYMFFSWIYEKMYSKLSRKRWSFFWSMEIPRRLDPRVEALQLLLRILKGKKSQKTGAQDRNFEMERNRGTWNSWMFLRRCVWYDINMRGLSQIFWPTLRGYIYAYNIYAYIHTCYTCQTLWYVSYTHWYFRLPRSFGRRLTGSTSGPMRVRCNIVFLGFNPVRKRKFINLIQLFNMITCSSPFFKKSTKLDTTWYKHDSHVFSFRKSGGSCISTERREIFFEAVMEDVLRSHPDLFVRDSSGNWSNASSGKW